ncbi:MAG TPA: hypothetical protein V6D03_05935 [Candidatus Caenarcaniphilales bacterium]
MSDNPIVRSPSDDVVLTSAHAGLVPDDSLNLGDLDKQRLAGLAQELRRLYMGVGLLSGVVLFFVASLSGLTIWLKLEQEQLARQVSSLSAVKAEVDRVRNLETQVNVLSQKVPKELSSQRKSTQDQLKKLQTRIEAVNARVTTSDQASKNLLQVLQGLNAGGQSKALTN